MRCSRRSASRGFTLVEMLVVLIIIATIMGFLVPGILAALKRGRIAAVKTEITQLEQAIESFRAKYGTYPPDASTGSTGSAATAPAS